MSAPNATDAFWGAAEQSAASVHVPSVNNTPGFKADGRPQGVATMEMLGSVTSNKPVRLHSPRNALQIVSNTLDAPS